MDIGLSSFVVFLSILWFLLYWILGGVFFAVVAILRLGRVRKVRFSCLFSLLSLACAIGTAYLGVSFATPDILACPVELMGKAQAVVTVIGCGFRSIMGTFGIGTLILLLGGFIIMSISQSKAKPWIKLAEE